jgi:predicted Co/Zn/Cd cation transporter (cation efflux family)
MDNKMNFNNNPVQGSIDIKSYVYKVLAYWKLFSVTLFIAFIVAYFLNNTTKKFIV